MMSIRNKHATSAQLHLRCISCGGCGKIELCLAILLTKEIGSMSHRHSVNRINKNNGTSRESSGRVSRALLLLTLVFTWTRRSLGNFSAFVHPTYVSLMFVLVLVFPVLFFLLMKKRRSTALIGTSRVLLFLAWASVPLLWVGFVCYIPMFPVLLMLMVLFLLLLLCLVGCGGVVPRRSFRLCYGGRSPGL